MAALSLAVVALFAVARTAISIRIFTRTALRQSHGAKADPTRTERRPKSAHENER
jgi:hypothetical protein